MKVSKGEVFHSATAKYDNILNFENTKTYAQKENGKGTKSVLSQELEVE
jgi:hypothetical protein